MPQTYKAGDSKVIWAEDQFMKELDAVAMRNMAMALTFLKLRVQQNVSKPARGAGPRGGMIHSKPGEFPRKIEGDLQRSIFRRGPRRAGARGRYIEGDVGTALDYAVHHEITGRSFLRRTLMEQQVEIGQILSGGIGKPGAGKKGPGYRYSKAEIAAARKMAASGMSIAEISKRTGMSRSHTRGVTRGTSRKKG